MLGWIPLIGPVIDGLVSIFNKYKDVEAIKYKTDGEVSIEGVKASAQIIAATKDDIGIRIIRDSLLIPVVAYIDLYVWDRIMDIQHPELVWGVRSLDAMPYLIMSVVTFLLGNIGINAWRRK